MALDFNSPEPLHNQLKELIRSEVLKGNYTGKIPSERVLMETYSVSRTTIRLALSDLVHEGILVKRHGRGTFTSKIPVQDWLGSFRSITETIRSMNMEPGTRLLSQGEGSCSKKIKEKLKVDTYYSIGRLRFADDIPIVIEKHYYPVKIGNKLKEFDLHSAVLYDLLQSSLGVNLWKAQQMIMSGKPTESDAEYLAIDTNSSVLLSERLIKDPDGKPVEFLQSVFRSDMYAFNIELVQRGK
ncbi:GntR family transcriptional regulator [Lentibacillus kapialis]|uniref:GntR family transcriptional regulator n=1 Tax=Lentibacillus kapialis TaxID=340214 RepID=A0A917Q265_9BACI|nr:GntR family transcriptional regulator [Lentibacillus kapialis]GGK08678.1 GntR family transcriptional regulator [Lentibacillus kapialis]